MPIKVKRLLSCFAAAAILLSMLVGLGGMLERKSSSEKYARFFREEQDFDVLFLGTSHMIYGVFPMELWDDYGITSYNLGGHSSHIPSSYWILRNALDYTTPKVVVLDCYWLSKDEKVNENTSRLHYAMDAFPLTLTKFRGINDLFDGTSGDVMKKAGFLWDFTEYHSRWNELEREDFEIPSGLEMGADTRNVVCSPDCFPQIPAEQQFTGNSTGIDYLERIIKECTDRDIEVLLTYLPFPASEERQMEANRVRSIAEEWNIPYINFLQKDIVNYDTDCSDSDSHLNASGSKKVTGYLGKFLQEQYGLEDHRGDEAYSRWNADYDAYSSHKLEMLKNQTRLDNYLMMLADDDYDLEIQLGSEAVLHNQRCRSLLANLGLDPDTMTVSGAEDRDVFITIRDRKNGVILDQTAFALADPVNDENITQSVVRTAEKK